MYLSGRVGGWDALEEWKLRLTSVKVEFEIEAELGKILHPCKSNAGNAMVYLLYWQ